MRFQALGLSIIGLFLMSYLLFYSPIKVDKLEEKYFHKVVAFSGKVTKESVSGTEHYLQIGNVSARCSCGNNYFEGKTVNVFGLVDEYNGKMYARVLRISII